MKMHQAPSSIGATVSTGKPVFNSTKSVTIRHQEYLCDLISTGTGFNVLNTFIIQPGDFNAFPWLSAMAARYQMYRFKHVSLQFISETPTSAAGAVILGYDRNAAAPAPAAKIQMMELQDSIKCNAWDSAALSINTGSDKKYTNSGSVYPAGPTGTAADIKTFATGVFWAGTSGVSAGTVGELYINYEIELMNPGIYMASPYMLNANFQAPTTTTLFSATNITQKGNLSIAYSTNMVINFTAIGPIYLQIIASTTAASAGGVFVVTSGGTLNGSVDTHITTTTTTVFGCINATGLVVITFSGFTNLSTSGYSTLQIMPYDSLAYGVIVD